MAATSTSLVNRQNFMLFAPMLPEIASGSLETRHIAQPLRASLKATQFELGDIIWVATDARSVTLRHPLTHECRTLEYDELVLALGSTSSTMGVPGIEKFTLALKTIADAVQIRNRVIGALEVAAKTLDLVERDRLLRFVIVGGGFTGVEAAGELQGFVHSILRYYPSIERSQIDVVLVESCGQLLAHLPPKFGKSAAASLRGRGVRIILGKRISAADGHGLELEDNERFESHTIVWSAGVEP